MGSIHGLFIDAGGGAALAGLSTGIWAAIFAVLVVIFGYVGVPFLLDDPHRAGTCRIRSTDSRDRCGRRVALDLQRSTDSPSGGFKPRYESLKRHHAGHL